MKRCTVCKIEREDTCFVPESRGSVKRKAMCNPCTLVKREEWLEKKPLYSVYLQLKYRCDNKNNKAYKNYGGRGITYDPKWRTYEGFWEDMGSSWVKGLTIDRIDNNGPYSKENCRWATYKEQMSNTRINRYAVFNGETKTLTEWYEYRLSRPQTNTGKDYRSDRRTRGDRSLRRILIILRA